VADPRRSVFVKLLAILLATGGAIAIVVSVGIGLATRRDPHSQRFAALNLGKYLRDITSELGTPPDEAAVRRLSNELDLEMRVEHGGRAISTEDDLPAIAELRQHRFKWRRRFGYPIGRYDDRLFLIYDRGGTSYAFFTPPNFIIDFREEYMIPVALLLAAILGGSWLAFRRVLSPLRDLSAGVAAMGQGKLEVDVPVKGKDELGALASSFNSMARRVQEMVASREQLLLDVSHELRSPMTRIKLALEMMEGDAAGRKSIADDLREMERLTSSLLDSARLYTLQDGLPTEDLDIGALATALAGPYRARAPGVTGPASGAVNAAANPEATATAFRNVLENALKYASDAARPIDITLETAADAVFLVVTDYGPGLPEAELERVFEPFYRVDKSRSKETGGFGLGLSLARRLMRAQGGDVTLTSGPGRGVRAELRFKRASA